MFSALKLANNGFLHRKLRMCNDLARRAKNHEHCSPAVRGRKGGERNIHHRAALRNEGGLCPRRGLVVENFKGGRGRHLSRFKRNFCSGVSLFLEEKNLPREPNKPPPHTSGPATMFSTGALLLHYAHRWPMRRPSCGRLAGATDRASQRAERALEQQLGN